MTEAFLIGVILGGIPFFFVLTKRLKKAERKLKKNVSE